MSDQNDRPTTSQPSGRQRVIAECFGTFVLVFLGCGAVHTSVLLGAQQGIWQIAIVWGVAIALVIFAIDQVSGAHINPAMTLSLAVWGRHPWSQVFPYLAAQFVGAFAAAAVLFCLFSGFLDEKEREKGVVRGEPGSIVTAMCYGEYFPSPGPIATAEGTYDAAEHERLRTRFGHGAAWCAEFLGTFLLATIVFALTDSKNGGRPQANLAPVFIGLTVSALISVFAPLTQACFNPARDFGPRCFAFVAGWGSVAIPGLSDLGWLTVYIVAPILGAIVGGGFYQTVLASPPPASLPPPSSRAS